MKCSICGKEIEEKNGWTRGNNAWPINDGRCCDVCDRDIVTPRRITDMIKRDKERRQQHEERHQSD